MERGWDVGESRIVWPMQWDGRPRPRPPSGSVRQDYDTVSQTLEDLGPHTYMPSSLVHTGTIFLTSLKVIIFGPGRAAGHFYRGLEVRSHIDHALNSHNMKEKLKS